MPAHVEPPDIFGYSIFCDDIRVEVDGKVTYVGAYGGRMYVHPEFPTNIPKFGISVTFYQLKEMFLPNLGLRIFLPGDPEDQPSILGDFNETADGAALTELRARPLPESRYISVKARLVMTPLILKEPGVITVRVLRGDNLHRVGRLTVLQGQSVETPGPSSEP